MVKTVKKRLLASFMLKGDHQTTNKITKFTKHLSR